MDWNKKNLRYRRPKGRRKKGFFTGLGAKLKAVARKIFPSSAAKAPAPPKTPVTIEEIFGDLKISLPKTRTAPPPPPAALEAEAEYASTDFELAENLEKDYLANNEELETEIYNDIAYSLNEQAEAGDEPDITIVPDTLEIPPRPPLWATVWATIKAAAEKFAQPGRLKILGIAVAIVIIIGGIWWAASRFTASVPVASAPKIPIASLPTVDAPPPGFFARLAEREQRAITSEYSIRQGDTLSQALEALGLGARTEEAQAVIDCLIAERWLDVVRPGATLRAFWSDAENPALEYLEYHPASGDPPFVVRPGEDGKFWLYSLASPTLTVTSAARGEVESTLWEAGRAAELEPAIIMNMADIMASELDFLSDIHKGDSFEVLYSRKYADGRPIGEAHVEMLRMTTSGADYELYRYINGRGDVGYYDQLGRSNKKTFFNSPLQYTNISSGFSKNRLHPIFKVSHAHEAVDYAAPTGTPVSSVADGVVVFAGWSGGYGRLITIKHDDVYTTMYAHLSRFAAGLQKGDRVSQGDLIGYVGASGAATGPHLDFRMKQNNTFIDPQAVLAKQEGQMLEAAEAQAFSQLVTAARNRMREHLEARPGM